MPRGVPAFTESAALTFGAASDRVDCGSPVLFDNLATMTILAWVYPTARALNMQIVGKRTSGGIGWSFQLSGTTSDLAFRGSSSLNYVTSNTPFATLDQWYCLSLLRNTGGAAGARAAIYSGTQLVPLALCALGTTVDGVPDDSAANWLLGNRDGLDAPWTGRQAVVAVFNRLLSLPELIAWQFSALDEPFPAVMAGCVGLWYPGNEGAGKVIEYSGYHNDGTVTGATLSRGVALLARSLWTESRPRYLAPAAVGGLPGFWPEQLGLRPMWGIR